MLGRVIGGAAMAGVGAPGGPGDDAEVVLWLRWAVVLRYKCLRQRHAAHPQCFAPGELVTVPLASFRDGCGAMAALYRKSAGLRTLGAEPTGESARQRVACWTWVMYEAGGSLALAFCRARVFDWLHVALSGATLDVMKPGVQQALASVAVWGVVLVRAHVSVSANVIAKAS